MGRAARAIGCDRTGTDLGGAAIRALDQSQDKPVYVVRSTFTGGCAPTAPP